MSIFLLFFLSGFAAGVVFGCVFGADYRDYAGILSEYYLSRYPYMEPDDKFYFLYLLKERMLPAALLILLTGTAPGMLLMTGYLGWMGFSLGTTLTLSVIRFGGKGILLCVAAMLPQYLLYAAAWYLLIIKGAEAFGSCVGRYSSVKKGRVGVVLSYLAILTFLVVGILAETFLNPTIVKGILKIL